ncbi:MAG TPA: ornithine cyclodeaminase family protein [Casimicrobiaceae bacterium]|nr:ornithine cyclodeaminase family protein [Casimicrobiaceae bacterium]
MRVVDAAETERALPFARLIPALREMFVGGCVVPPRHHHRIELDTGPAATLLLMPAWNAHDALGVKIVNVFPGNADKGLPGLYSLYCLFDAEHGTPIALLDGNVITSRRTAAVSALAASYLARPDADWLLVVGAGRIASLLPEAYREVRAIRRVTVWNRTPAAAQALVDRLRALDFDASVAPDLEAAVRAADIVTCATLATEPLVLGDWLHPGIHLDLIGSFTPEMRETDDTAIRRTSVFVDTETALAESGDLVQPLQSGAFVAGRLAGTLSDLCAGRRPGRRAAQELTLFKAVGTAMSDLAAAMIARTELGLTSSAHPDK